MENFLSVNSCKDNGYFAKCKFYCDLSIANYTITTSQAWLLQCCIVPEIESSIAATNFQVKRG